MFIGHPLLDIVGDSAIKPRSGIGVRYGNSSKATSPAIDSAKLPVECSELRQMFTGSLRLFPRLVSVSWPAGLASVSFFRPCAR